MCTMAVRPSCTAINASQQDAKGVEAAIDMILSFFLSIESRERVRNTAV